MILTKEFSSFLVYDSLEKKFSSYATWCEIDLKRVVIFADSNFNMILRKPSRELYRKFL